MTDNPEDLAWLEEDEWDVLGEYDQELVAHTCAQIGTLLDADQIHEGVVLGTQVLAQLDVSPPQLLKMLGICLVRAGDNGEAAKLLLRALNTSYQRTDPDNSAGLALVDGEDAETLIYLSIALLRQRRIEEAMIYASRGVGVGTASVRSWKLLLRMVREHAPPQYALGFVRLAIDAHPGVEEFLAQFVETHVAQGLAATAIDYFVQHFGRNPPSSRVLLLYAQAAQNAQNAIHVPDALPLAKQHIVEALSAAPNDGELNLAYAIVLAMQGEVAQAFQLFESCFHAAPHLELPVAGMIFSAHTREQAVTIRNWLENEGNTQPRDWTVRQLLRVITLLGDWNGQARMLHDSGARGKEDGSLASLGWNALRRGNWHEARGAFSRIATPDTNSPSQQPVTAFGLPPLLPIKHRYAWKPWRGQQVNGRDIFIWADDYAGDTLQFLRFVQELVEAGGQVRLVVPQELVALCANLPVEVLDAAKAVILPDQAFYCTTTELALVLASQTTIPKGGKGGGSYLPIAADHAAFWQQRLAELGGELVRGVRRVGVFWQHQRGDIEDCRRNIDFALFAKLFRGEGAQFVSFQSPHGLATETSIPAEWVGAGRRLVDLAPHISDFQDMAAALLQLDLLITTDAPIAHLAGALGVPVWVLVPQAGDWRWGEGSEDSTEWYPRMRIFRQPFAWQWQEAIAEVSAELKTFLRS